MALVNMKVLLQQAQEEGFGVGAFSVANMEMILGTIKAAEELNSPVILQIAQVRLPYSPLDVIGPMMLAAAKKALVPVAVHFDHGTSLQVIKQALELGFTSVMIDASRLPIRENIQMVNQVKEIAALYSASVEAEVGQIGGSEGGECDTEMFYSKTEDVVLMYQETKADAIALSIGNAHGLYKKEPKLRFELLEKAKKAVPVPLVLHGGSGISDEDFYTCIQKGICKINIATANFMAVQQGAREYSQNEKNDYFTLSEQMVQHMYENVKHHIQVFRSQGKARR